MLLLSVTYNVASAANDSTEQKFQTLKEQGIFTGFSDGSSRLYESMTREQFAVVLARLYTLSNNTGKSSFGDVLRTRWSYNEIEAVAKAGLMNGVSGKKFSPETNVTVEQLAAILVRAEGYSAGRGSSYVVGKVSPWAKDVVRAALDQGLISSMNDYTVNATRGMLVEAVYSIYQDIHPKPIILTKVEPLSKTSIRITVQQPISNTDMGRIKLTDFYGNILKIGMSSISNDGLTITLWTDRMISGIVHTLSIGDNVSWAFVSISDDTTKPTVTSVRVQNNYSILITFSEPVDPDSATNTNNYRLTNGLRITRAQLTTNNTVVVLTTSDQVDGANYQLTVRNVKDPAGNTMDNYSTNFSTDYSKPKVTSVQVNATATLTVKFNEPVNRTEAERTNNYALDKGLRVTQAILAKDDRTVTLKTTDQKDGELYVLTVSGISDLVGNYMDTSTNWKFGGVANPVVPVQFNAIKAINNNTVEVGFSRPITDADVANLKLYVLYDNNANVAMNDWSQFVMRKDDRTVTVQYRTKASNPKLFNPGHVYVAKVAGVASLATSDGQDQLEFAGISVDNPNPEIKQVVAIGSNRVKVVFSEPVTNVSASAFQIRQLDGKNVPIDSDELGDRNKIVTEVVLRLVDDMTWNWQYVLAVKSDAIADAAKFNGLKSANGDPVTYTYSANW